MKTKKGFTYRLYQGGMQVACAWSMQRKLAEREIQHYAAVYSQDGPVVIKPRIKA